jgi:hypothetical protein
MLYRYLMALFLAGLVAFFMPGCGGGGASTSSSSSTSSTPTITTQPSSQSVTVGASVTFSVVATSSSTMSYQWRKGGTAISGATSSSYTISTVAASNAGSYDVVITNSSGSTTSSTAILSVTSADGSPLITLDPESQSVNLNGTVTFTVVATGSGTLSYQWYKGSSAISGATTSSYTISSVASSAAGTYYAVVSSSSSSTTATSATATLTVTTTTNAISSLSSDVYTAATNFLGSFTSTATVNPSYTLTKARHWSNLPASMVSRNGVAWSALSSSQKTLARTLISTALSATGNTLHLGLQAADDELVSAYSASSSTYGSGNYYIALLGTPSSTGFWILQLTGHHLTYNIAFNGSSSSPTPMFLGVEPKGSFTLNGTTYDPMSAQRTAVANLAADLSSYSSALLSGSYDDLLFGANYTGNIDGTIPRSYPTGTSSRGILVSSLSSLDRYYVIQAIKAYVNTQATAMSDALLASYLDDTNLSNTYVAYAGGTSVYTKANYFRIDGPRVWIEFSVQNGVIVSNDIHYHTIWRDKSLDYGGQTGS